MYTGGSGGNRDGLARLRTEHLARRRDQLGQDHRRGGGGGGLQVLARRGERPAQRPRKGEAREPGLEGLQPAAVVPARHRMRGEQPLGGTHHQPKREQSLARGSAYGVGHQTDQPLFRRRGGADHATRRSTAAATSAGVMSARQRWWPRGHAAVPVAEQGRQSSSRSSTTEGATYGKKPNCATVGPNRATTGVPTPVAMCMMPVSPDTTTRARCSNTPVSCSENSPATLAAAPPATSCCARPRSSGPPTTTVRYPAAPRRSPSAAQCAMGQRLVAWAAPGPSAASVAPARPRSASHCATRVVAPAPRQNWGGPPSGRASSRRAASK